MFLSRRTMQEEYFDSDRPWAEVAEFFQSLGRVNRFFDFTHPFRNLIPALVGEADCQSLWLLDLGAGDGSLGKTVCEWAAQRGWNWRVVNLDSNVLALGLNENGLNVAASATQLPFGAGSFDVVLAASMAHHLKDGEVTLLLREAWRVARRGVLVCDLHRNLALYLALKLLFCFQDHPVSFKSDALLSVKRGWRKADLTRLAEQAGLDTAQVKLYFGARLILQARKAAGNGSP
jgi:ubiquinone/menaquinone biosynthesis C-methylase UbiE